MPKHGPRSAPGQADERPSGAIAAPNARGRCPNDNIVEPFVCPPTRNVDDASETVERDVRLGRSSLSPEAQNVYAGPLARSRRLTAGRLAPSGSGRLGAAAGSRG